MPGNFFRRFTKTILIIVNIVLALVFLLACYGGNLDPATWWYTGLLTLSAFYLFILLVGFLVFWLFAKPRWSMISVVAILIAFKPVSRIIPLRFSAPFELKKDTGSLRVMSWNVEHFDILEHKTHPENKQKMLDLINEYQPDLACFQEMVGSDRAPRSINYLPDISNSLDFSDYFYSFNPKLDFDDVHHFGLIIFSKYPLINKQTLSFYPHDYNSIFQYADMVRGKDTFRVFNLHLQSLKFSSDNLKYIDDPEFQDKEGIRQSKNILGKFRVGFLKRMIQARRVRAEIDKSPYPVIVCGDFNDVPNSYAYRTIGQGLKNAFEEKGAGIGRTFSGISPTLRIDNIFAGKRFSIDQYRRVVKKLSDHFPLFADLRLEKN
ncbi:MAG: endonuclease/exonuclease/phosphatase family protein [Chitinophagaceae bacterium]|nr:endonuclease/exonuclease/phosphatase family protein [Chitinophagaceae bacterium]MBL0055200.1 endonuclease/exonuclease/phosphatase family protein [Chitinophagaceae bacterium]